MADQLIRLRPIVESPLVREAVEARIRDALQRELYEPLMRSLGASLRVLNSKDSPLVDALARGHLTFTEGYFVGALDASVTKILRELGATWDKREKAFYLPLDAMPTALRISVVSATAKFSAKVAGLEKQLDAIESAKVAEAINVQKIFHSNLRKVDEQLTQSLPRNLTIVPEVSAEQLDRIASEWEGNLQLTIKGWADDEILKLREAVKANTMAGNRFEAMVETIQNSFGVGARKAHFLARQETNLLTSKFKEVRYAEAGVYEYEWRIVVGSPKHPVRPSHKVLNGRIFRFDSPPITTGPGQPVRRCNPGEDYGCRCGAHPVIRRLSRAG